MASQGYKDLVAWQKAMALVKKIYLITKAFPKDELYALTNQMRRAAVSIPSNLAEGSIKSSTKDFMRFISIARGSTAELETQLLISQDLGYISEEGAKPILEDVSEIGRMLSGLYSTFDKDN